MGKHKQVVCKKCCRVMRSDVLNRHMKAHEKLREDSLDRGARSVRPQPPARGCSIGPHAPRTRAIGIDTLTNCLHLFQYV